MASRNAPMSVAEVVAQAGNYTYNAHIPLANWLRTANTMQKEVCCAHIDVLRHS
jgi:STAM-binding protein